MRSHPSCWNSTLARLGFKRRERRLKKEPPSRHTRRNLFEALETRELLAADYFVTTLDDVAVAGDPVAGSDNVWSLREALGVAVDGEEIGFDPSLMGQIDLQQSLGQLVINSDVTITGPGADRLTIDAGGHSRVFIVGGTGTQAVITDVTIQNGDTGSGGGVLLNSGNSLTLDSVALTGNQASTVGGGVYNDGGTLTVRDSTIEGNDARFGAGIGANSTSTTTIERSAFIENNATHATFNDASGGGLRLANGAAGTVTNTTFSGNTAEKDGGGIELKDATSTLTVVNATITENDAAGSGGGLDGPGFTLHNTILAGNTAGTAGAEDTTNDLHDSSSYNVLGTGVTTPATGAGNTSSDNPGLTVLGDYGGPTRTHALKIGSPAIDAGSNTQATNAGLTLDQRGYGRVVYASSGSPGGDTVDIGASERQFVVTTLEDELDSVIGPEDLSLREALQLANSASNPGPNRIQFAPGLGNRLTLSYDQSGVNYQDQMNIDSDVEIVGPGSALLTIDADADALRPLRVFQVFSGVTASLEGLTITGGYSVAGSAVYSQGDLALRGVEVLDNQSVFDAWAGGGGGFAGGVANVGGTLHVIDSTIANNTAETTGGGVASIGGTLLLESVQIHGNAAQTNNGGGLYVSNGDVSLQSTNIERNQALSGGGFFSTNSSVFIDRSAISHNLAEGSGGGLFSVLAGGQSFRMLDSAVEHNTAAAHKPSGLAGGAAIWGPSHLPDPVDGTVEPAAGTVDIEGSTFAENSILRADQSVEDDTIENTNLLNHNRAGLYIHHVDTAKVSNSTVSGNVAEDLVGGLSIGRSNHVELVHNTVAFNSSFKTNNAGLDLFLNGSVVAHNNLIAGNRGTAADSNVSGNLGAGVNLTGDGADLAPLADNGGPTRTHALLPGSTASNSGDNNQSRATDQRGLARPVGGTVDVGAYEGQTPTAWGDFDGDSRVDALLYDPSTGRLVVTAGAGDQFSAEWGRLEPAGVWDGFAVGNFDGDGRDDVLARRGDTGEWSLLVSDGTLFVATALNVQSTWAEDQLFVGDFDGDGVDELLGRNSISANWGLLDLDEHLAATVDPDVGTALNNANLDGKIFVGDANLDGRDDLMGSVTAGDPGATWFHTLSTPDSTSGDAVFFASATNAGTWYSDHYSVDPVTGEASVDAGGRLREAIDLFAEVYNNVELELYPGLMKGVEATAQTKAGNPWDQAALLVDRLEAAGFDARIASGVLEADLETVKQWIGSPDTSTGGDLANNLGKTLITATQASVTTVLLGGGGYNLRFQHAWVELDVPTPAGFAAVSLDPSWKFKDRQQGIQPANPNELITPFDFVDYLSQERKELLVEYYEDEVMDHLISNHPGASLADVPHDGPIIHRRFESVPAVWGTDAGIYDSNPADSNDEVSRFENFSVIAGSSTDAQAHTHRVQVTLTRLSSNSSRDEDEILSQELIVPEVSLEEITLDLTQGANPELRVGGSTYTASGNLLANESVRITFSHLDLGEEIDGTKSIQDQAASIRTLNYVESVGKKVALGLAAGQHSQQTLADLQANLISEVQTVDAGDIDDLLVYTLAKYWRDYDRDNQTLAGLSNKAYVRDTVGSGIATADGATPTEYDYLPYRIVPDNMGVDLKNGNGAIMNWDASFHEQSLQMAIYNGSALEHAILEEVINSESISTIKGLQQAFQEDGVTFTGGATTANEILVFDSYDINAGTSISRSFRQVGSFDKQTAGAFDLKPVGDIAILQSPTLNSGDIRSLLHHEPSGDETNPNSFAASIISELSSQEHDDPIRVFVPAYRNQLGVWVGGVYVAESFGDDRFSISMTIAPVGGAPSNGGYTGGTVTQENTFTPPVNFTNFTYAGDPVNVANGNMFRDEVDFSAPNLGVPLTLARHYDAQSDYDIGLGVGWTHTFGDLLYHDDSDTSDPDYHANNVTWLRPDGSRQTFLWQTNKYKVPAGLHGEFEKVGTTFSYRDRHGMEYHFEETSGSQGGLDLRGRLTSQVDNVGNGVNITYIGTTGRRMHRVSDVRDATRYLLFDVNGTTNLIADVTVNIDGNQGTWVYGYGAKIMGTGAGSDHRLRTVDAPQVEVVEAGGTVATAHPRVQYDYYEAAPHHALGKIEKITEADGGWHNYEYYPNGRAFRVTDDLGGVQTFNYNLFRNLTEFTDERGHTTTYVHRDDGLLETQIHADRTRMRYEWGAPETDFSTLMLSNTDERGAVETFKYYDTAADFRYRELKESYQKDYVAEDGLLTRYDYSQPSGRNHMINLATVTVDPDGTLGTGDDVVSSFQYSNLGQRVRAEDALGNVTLWDYYATTDPTSPGLLKSETLPEGVQSVGASPDIVAGWYVLDADFNVTGDTLTVELNHPGGENGWIVDAVRVDRLDDDYTRVIDDAATDGGGFSVTGTPSYVQNTAGHYGGDRTFINNASQSAAWSFTDLEPGLYKVSASWLPSPASVRSETVDYEIFDGDGSAPSADVTVSNVSQKGDDSVFSFFSQTTVFTYDGAGNLTDTENEARGGVETVYDHWGNPTLVTDPTGVVTASTYDALGRLTSSGWASTGTTTPLGGFTSTFEYDAAGRLRRATDPLGRTTTSVYDTKGNLLSSTGADGAVETFEYDRLNNLVLQTDPLGRETAFQYDARNRLIATTLADGAQSVTRYDGSGNVAAARDPLGNETTFAYDAVGRLTATTNALGKSATNDYDTRGDLVATTDFRNVRTEFKHDKLGRVIETRVLDPVGTKPLALLTTVDYDRNGNAVASVVYDTVGLGLRSDGVGEPSDVTSLIDTNRDSVQITRTDYDRLNRPVVMTYDDGTTVVTTYDHAGRVARTQDERKHVTELIYDGFGRLVQTILPDPDDGGPLASPVSTTAYDAAGQAVAVTDANGHTTRLVYDQTGRLVATVDPLGNEERTVFDTAGQVVATVNALGHASHVLYDKRGRRVLSRSADPDGNGTLRPSESRFAYDAAGNLVSSTDALGLTTTYEYDKLNRLKKQNYDVRRVLNAGDEGYEATKFDQIVNLADGYLGDAQRLTKQAAGTNAKANFVFHDLDPGEYKLLITWPDGSGGGDNLKVNATPNSTVFNSGQTITALGIDQSQPVEATSELSPFKVEHHTLHGEEGAWLVVKDVITITDAPTRAMHLVFTSANDADLVVDAVMLVREVTESLAYDAEGNLISSTDALGRVTEFTHDALGRQTKVTLPDPQADDPAGNPLPRPFTTTEYDGFGNVVRTVENRGGSPRTTEWAYDERNRVVKETLNSDGSESVLGLEEVVTSFGYDEAGNLVLQVDDLGGASRVNAKTEFTYDALNRLKTETSYRSTGDTEGLVTQYAYDPVGNLVGVTDITHDPNDTGTLSVTTAYAYDAANRRTAVTTAAGTGLAATSTTVYDAAGNPVLDVDPLAGAYRSAYDRLNRLVAATDPDPDAWLGAGEAAVTTFAYDAAGNLLAETNGEGEAERFWYDPLGRLVRTADGNGDQTQSAYDAVGNLVRYADPSGNATSYTYDDLDRLATDTITLSGGVSTRSYVYNGKGHLSRTVDRNGRRTDFTYDDLDRLVLEQWRNPGGAIVHSLAWELDGLGRVVKASDIGAGDARVDTYEYDALGRLLVQRNYDPNQTPLPSTPKVEQAWTHDEVVAVWGVEGHELRSFDGVAHTPLASSDTYRDRLGRTDVVDGGGGWLTGYDYDAADRLTEIERDGVFTTAYGYDLAGRVASIGHTLAGASDPFTEYAFEYDRADRIVRRATAHDQALSVFGSVADEVEALAFDQAGRLTGDGSETFGYDESGNRASLDGGAAHTIGPHNRLEADDDFTYQYDGEGNLTRKTSKADNSYTTYEWDYRNRLTGARFYNGSGVLQEEVGYAYDASDRLVQRTVGGALTGVDEYYVHGDGHRVLTLDDAGAPARRHVWGPGVDNLVLDQSFDAQGALEAPLWAAADHLGSVRQLVNDTGAVVEHREYAAFGAVESVYDATGASVGVAGMQSGVGFAGTFHDADTGFNEMRRRWYNPDTGTFVSEDPIQDGVNWYAYAGSDPVNFRDPTGLAQAGNPLNNLAGGFGTGGFTPPARSTFGGAAVPPANPTFSQLAAGFTTVGPSTAQTNRSFVPSSATLNSVNRAVRAERDNIPFADQFQTTPVTLQGQTRLVTDVGTQQIVFDPVSGVSTGEVITGGRFGGDIRTFATPDVAANLVVLENPNTRDLSFQAIGGAGVLTAKTAGQLAVRVGREVVEEVFTGVQETTLGTNLPLPTSRNLRPSSKLGLLEQGRNSRGQFLPLNPGEVLPGASRQARVEDKLVGKFGRDSVQREQFLRTADGSIAIDPVTQQARRIDFAVIRDGKAVGTVEVTSKTANKSRQEAKELNIRKTGGTFVLDRNTGELIDFSNARQITSRRR